MGWREQVSRYRVDLILFAVSLVAYAISSGGMLAHQSLAPHFVYQADAFLHGQLAIRGRPPNLNDWVFQDGRWYVSFPPFPAVLMMPFVALRGLDFNDVWFTLVFAALNVALLYRLLRRMQPQRAEWEHAAFALIFGFGTLAWSCGIRGEVWYTAETVGVTLTLLYLHAALEARHPVLAGLAVACAAITRTPLALSAVFFVFEALSPDRPVEPGSLRDRARWRAALPRLERKRRRFGFLPSAGEIRRQVLLLLPEDVHGKAAGAMNDLGEVRLLLDAEEHQRRVERQRRERVRRHAPDAAVDVRGDDGHARDELSDRVPELAGIDLHRS